MLETKKIMDLAFVNSTMNELTMEICNRIEQNTRTFIVTANPEIVMYANEHRNYKEVLEDADYIIPDGIGIVIGSQILNNPLSERLAGFDLMGQLLDASNTKGYKLYFLGASPEVMPEAVKKIKSKYQSNIHICGYHHGYFDQEKEQYIIEEIRMHQPDLIFIGLGFPRQEEWIHRYIDSFDKGIFMGVGGSFDVWAGNVKRAPLIWQKLNIEWLYRLMKQPSRWRRMLVLPQFLVKVIKIRLHN
ncbi:WecB/TagA/CpsF family glycosyltransferase [Bacillus sp. PS06]|uniref:WecB/TagA/CpsF family glycosyltransferase n=1 Tax=Bacillus sp. PS06 TaxID=2764176 RepID=UPI00296E4082|nr:WecB/TagA/CpsF family glycosyltransferase [Bacillus sp. PS06]